MVPHTNSNISRTWSVDDVGDVGKVFDSVSDENVLLPQLDQERIQKLSRELQKKEEWLQEERTEREKLEVELGIEKDCNRVNITECVRAE